MSNDLTPTQRRIWLDHGEVLSKYPVSVEAFARQLGVTRHQLRVVQRHVNEAGPPSEDDHPGAIHLVIPDAHAKPGSCRERFAWLGKEIEEVGREAMAAGVPFRVISIGDFADYPSLSHYDRGKRSSHGRTFVADVTAHRTALDYMRSACDPEVWNYADKHWTCGNHEERALRYMNDNPELEGVLHSAWDLMAEYGFEVHQFLDWCRLDGIGYCHYMQNENAPRPVGGVNVGRSLVLKGHRSIVVGHNHRLDTYTTTDCYGDPIQTLSCGCYFDHVESYAKQSNSRWWRGLCILRNVRNGGYNLETRKLDDIRRKYEADE